jgi:hypothetical protein
MYFSNYRDRKGTTINPSLLWEYDLKHFDYQAMRSLVVQRVIERGWPADWYAILNRYGEDGVKEAIRSLPYLNERDAHFVSLIFQIPSNEMACYARKPSRPTHWSS